MQRRRKGDGFDEFTGKKIKLSGYNTGTFKFDAYNPSFDGQFPYFRQPHELGNFSQDSSRTYHNDSRSLKHLILPDSSSVNFPLWTDYDTFISRDEEIKEYLDHLLKWIMFNKKCFTAEQTDNTSLNTDFVSWRGLLTKLLCTPFENREGWKIACCKFKKTIYMCEFDTEEKLKQKRNQTEQQKIMTYGGYKFEQYLCSDDPTRPPDVGKPVNNNEAYCSVVRSRLQQHSLVYGGEVDCCDTDPDKRRHYVELKTSREIFHARQDENFKRFKLLKWWAQSFLVGIPKIICGFRNDDGVVERLETFATLEIPKMCKHINNCWKANVCFNFLDQFLTYLKEIVVEDNPRVVYLFEFSPRQHITCAKQREDSEYVFLPDWYCNNWKETKT